jgi:hypothetical protein
MTPAERQYRRVLRLLPVGYRQLWEDDMVSAYLDRVAHSPRRSMGERLSVAWLALRLRLSGSHAALHTRLWYHAVLGIALLTTLYESLNATVLVAAVAGTFAMFQVDASWQNQIAYWWDAVSLVWVATFVCVVLGRVAAARVLVLIALLHELGLTALIVELTINPSWWRPLPLLFESSIIHQSWLFLTATAVLLIPNDFRPSRRWLAGYLVPAAVMVPIVVASVTGPDEPTWPRWLQLLQFVNAGTLLHIGLIVGMVIALLRVREWLLPLAVVGGGVAAVQLVGHTYGGDFFYELRQHGTLVWAWVNVAQLGLAAACGVAWFVAARRLRRAGAAQSRSQTTATEPR